MMKILKHHLFKWWH